VTKKLKKKVNRIAYAALAVIASVITVLCINAEVFVMPINIEKQNKTGVSEVANANSEIQALSVEDVIECESIVQGARDNNLADGTYTFRVAGTDKDGNAETKDYAVELINYYDDVHYTLGEGEETKTISLGDRTEEYKMLIVKYHKNLTIDAGVTVTASTAIDAEGIETELTYKKGMYLCVMGELKNSGNISMTARGTYNQEGENVYLWKNKGENKTQDFEYVPAVGAAGGAAVNSGYCQRLNGNPGGNGEERATGGGASGAVTNGDNSPRTISGAGAAGTSYSGGSGGGACNSNSNGVTIKAGDAEPNGGAGGVGYGYRQKSSWAARGAGGGAGNYGGNGAYLGYGNRADFKGENGTGGLLIIYTDYLNNDGKISANGMKGGVYDVAGGSSGGGSINIFCNSINSREGIEAKGGEMVGTGGLGGDGTVTINQLEPDLDYAPKVIYMDLNKEFTIDNLELINQNGIQTPILTMGPLKYESLDTNIVTVDSTGKITSKNYGTTKIKVTDTKNEIDTYIAVTVIRTFDSVVQGFRDTDLPDGNYIIAINNKLYDFEVINYYEDMRYSLAEGETEKIVELGDDKAEYKTLVVKYHKNLTVDEGVTLTAKRAEELTYKKGMYICVMGDIINRGNISMTARGTYNQEGENVYLWKNIDNTYEFVPAEGGIGGASRYAGRNQHNAGIKGEDGKDRATGGGGSGNALAGDESPTSYSGAGSQGTSYSGGSGGGAASGNFNGGSITAESAAPNGGKGGNAYSYRGSTGWIARYAGGGAGNIGGNGRYTWSNTGADWADGNGQNGTGGLLIIYTNDLYNSGEITAKGMNGGSGQAIGGSSGGGSINIFANIIKEKGTVSANGGTVGGLGGNGSVTINELQGYLNYNQKEVTIEKDAYYKIDNTKFEYVNQNGVQTPLIGVGTLKYESLDTNTAIVDSTGKITGINVGTTKIKITDTTNNISTYIFVNVYKGSKVDVQEGKNFTVALKENGTVWSYGLNDKGQLGIRNNESKNEPVQVNDLKDIKQVSTGYSHSLALTRTR